MEVSTLATLLLDLAVIVGAAQLLGGLVRRLDRSDYRPAERNARHLTGGRSA